MLTANHQPPIMNYHLHYNDDLNNDNDNEEEENWGWFWLLIIISQNQKSTNFIIIIVIVVVINIAKKMMSSIDYDNDDDADYEWMNEWMKVVRWSAVCWAALYNKKEVIRCLIDECNFDIHFRNQSPHTEPHHVVFDYDWPPPSITMTTNDIATQFVISHFIIIIIIEKRHRWLMKKNVLQFVADDRINVNADNKCSLRCYWR